MSRPTNLTRQDDFGAVLLADWIRDREPFTMTRFGDGDIQFMFNLRDGRTADGEINSPVLSAELCRSWCTLASHPRSIVGDFLSCGDFGANNEQLHRKEWDQMIHLAKPRRFVHIEAALLTRTSPALYYLYETIRKDTRRKLLVGPQRLFTACELLDADFHEIPLGHRWYDWEREVKDHIYKLQRHAAEVIFFSAGRSSKVMMAHLLTHNPDRVYFDLGSALDPYCVGRTRGVQVGIAEAKLFFQPIVDLVKDDAYRNLADLHEVAEAMQLPFYLMDGTLLGIVRDGDLCPGDEDDIDIGIPSAEFDRVLYLCEFMEARGFTVTERFEYKRARGCTPEGGSMIEGIKLKRGRSHFDLIRIHRHPERDECYNLGRRDDGHVLAFVYPGHHHQQGLDEIAVVRFLERDWSTPLDPEGFLTARYGDWRTPIPRNEFSWYTQSNRDSIRDEYDQL